MQNFNEIDCFLFDLDGTVYIGDKVFDGVLDALESIKKAEKRYMFVSNNSSLSAKLYYHNLNNMGFDLEQSDVYTSGTATCDYLKAVHSGKKIYLMGTGALKKEFHEKGITLTEENPDIVVVSFDKELTFQKLDDVTRFINEGALYVATHPDNTCPTNHGYIPDIGSFMALIKVVTNRTPDVICGKPYTIMGDEIAKVTGIRKERIAMVGDRLSTDIAFANNSGFKSIAVLTGETTKEDIEKSDLKVDMVLNSVADIKNILEKNN